WTFKDAPGVLLKETANPEELKISYDYGNHFETLDIPNFYSYTIAGWNVGEFFKEDYTDDWVYYLGHSLDFNQTVDTLFYPDSGYFEMAAGANEGELYTYYRSYYDTGWMSKYTLYYSSDYGRNNQMLMTIDSLDDGWITNMYWEFVADDEPGVFYSIIRDAAFYDPATGADSKLWIDYYRDYGETLVTTYFHHFTAVPEWFDHPTPVMDCEIVSYDQNSVTLRWNEPELKPDEVLVGYQVYRGETLVTEDLITETEFTDEYSGNGRLKYHVLAVYSDGEASKSYNIVYCEQTDGFDENGGGTKVAVFPNPTNGVVRIEGVAADEVRVYNAREQLVKRVKNSNEMSMEGLPQGVYLLRIIDTEGKKYVARVMKE
ncbi:MAG: T9SS type A sorting domain-containing protein, partial [Bacteroidales bacterium]|nr:T9SS type A sorting domain-containing protein [Bacteroidales bacterium]